MSSNSRWSMLKQKSKEISTTKKSLIEVQQDVDEENVDSSQSSAAAMTLNVSSKTRWDARHKATNALLRNFSNVIDCFYDLIIH